MKSMIVSWIFFRLVWGALTSYRLHSETRQPKLKTILISRVLAWFAAKRTVQNDAYGGIWGGKRVFLDEAVFVNPTQPGDKIFDDHVKDLFWRLYSRPPSETEINAVNDTWLDVYSQAAGGTYERAMRSWMAILYAMFSSQEFWHI